MNDWRGRLRDAVIRSGKKQGTIADEAGISRATLSRILNGWHVNPGLYTIANIAHAAGETVGWVFDEPGFTLSPVSNGRRCAPLPES